MYTLLKKLMLAVCRISLKRPYMVLAIVALVTIPAIIEVQKIFVDPNLVRLLPTTSRASKNTRELSAVTGDGGYFTMVFTADDTNALVAAADAAAPQIRALSGVHSVEYEWPVEFLEQYRYHLVPNDYLFTIYDKVLGWKSELSPMGINLLVEEKDSVQNDKEQSFEGDLRHYASLNPYNFSADEKNLGITVRTTQGIDEFKKVSNLFSSLTNIAANIKREYNVGGGIAGSQRNKIDEFNLINENLNTATLISLGLIFLVTAIGFRSVRTTIVVLIPLAIGMVWGFAFIPITVESLNLITSFLMLILTGMGIDYSIHMVKRVEQEFFDKPFEEAFLESFRNTGPSVLVSGFTTAFSLAILILSSFRGFSEFGIISGMVITCILASMVFCMPAVIVVAYRFGFIRGKDHRREQPVLLSHLGTIVSFVVVGICRILIATGLKFDASFRNLEFDRSQIEGLEEAREAQHKIYTSGFSPGAIFAAADLENLDRLLEIFDDRIQGKTKLEKPILTKPVTYSIDGEEVITYTTNYTTIDVARSIREYAPDPESALWDERLETLEWVQEEIREGVWIDKIENADRKKWITELRDWTSPPNPRPPTIGEVITGAPEISGSLLTKDGKNGYLVAVFPKFDRKSANNAIRFTEEIYDLVPESQEARDALGIGGVVGPVGETPIFAEIVTIVKGEIWWLTILTFLGVFILIWMEVRVVRESLFVMIPLASGFVFTFALMVLLGMNLNLFNVIMIPALLGMGVDDGVHMVTRWKELRENTRLAVGELFTPLLLTSVTTMMGYMGMVFVAHPGLRSIGWLAVIGMGMLWVTTILFLPGILQMYTKRLHKKEQKQA
jgi:predicted RND superfamily exporter protein